MSKGENDNLTAWMSARRARQDRHERQDVVADRFKESRESLKQLSSFSEMTLSGYGEGGFRGLRWAVIEEADVVATPGRREGANVRMACYTRKTNYYDHPVVLNFKVTPDMARRLAELFSAIADGKIAEEGVSA